MTPDNARKALRLLSRVPGAVCAINELPGLDTVDLRILEGVMAHAVLFARRMEAKARGENLTRVFDELRHSAAALREINPVTDKVQ